MEEADAPQTSGTPKGAPAPCDVVGAPTSCLNLNLNLKRQIVSLVRQFIVSSSYLPQ
jgi:hypothetical protein